jgi:hypothetical protein
LFRRRPIVSSSRLGCSFRTPSPSRRGILLFERVATSRELHFFKKIEDRRALSSGPRGIRVVSFAATAGISGRSARP